MLYRPLLPNGQQVPLPWQIYCFFINITWPLQDKAATWMRLLDGCKIASAIFSLGSFILLQMSELYFNRNDIVVMVQIAVTQVVATEGILRLCLNAFNKNEFKAYLREFYLKIYFDVNENPKMHHKILAKTRPTILFSYSYFITLSFYLITPVRGAILGQRVLPFQMTLPFDYTPLPIFFVSVLVCSYNGYLVVTNIVAESYLLIISILNLNGRLELLEQDILNLSNAVLESGAAGVRAHELADRFCARLIVLLQRNVELFKFAEKLEVQFTRSLFVTMSFKALSMCLVAFNGHEKGVSSDIVTYGTWLTAKVVELVIIGYLGSLISAKFDSLSFTYCSSNWEKVIYNSSNIAANVRTMKLMSRVIAFNQRPFMLTGMGFFKIDLETSLKLIRLAGSYFTFLCSLGNENEN